MGVVLGGKPVLEGVDLAIEAGEAVALVGPSGAGKTTLLRLFNGIVRPSAGELRVGGEPLGEGRALRRARARVGFVHQSHALVPNLRVASNVLMGRLGERGLAAALRAQLLPRRGELERVHALLERVGIEEKLFERTDTLSGGQQQRVAIARALYQDPAVLLADEPLASVDPARGRDLLALLLELARERGITLVASLHDLEAARASFPRIVGLRAGRVRFDAPAAVLSGARFEELYRLEERSAGT